MTLVSYCQRNPQCGLDSCGQRQYMFNPQSISCGISQSTNPSWDIMFLMLANLTDTECSRSDMTAPRCPHLILKERCAGWGDSTPASWRSSIPDCGLDPTWCSTTFEGWCDIFTLHLPGNTKPLQGRSRQTFHKLRFLSSNPHFPTSGRHGKLPPHPTIILVLLKQTQTSAGMSTSRTTPQCWRHLTFSSRTDSLASSKARRNELQMSYSRTLKAEDTTAWLGSAKKAYQCCSELYTHSDVLLTWMMFNAVLFCVCIREEKWA